MFYLTLQIYKLYRYKANFWKENRTFLDLNQNEELILT